MRVAIIGGGIGGLTLAHGLRRAGIAVDVHERTLQRTDWLQGYRIHINPAGADALRECLPPETWQRFLDTVSTGDGGFGFLTDQGRELLALDPGDGPRRHYAVSRLRLRELLLDQPVHFGRTFTRYELHGDRVTALFEDGSSTTADLLVGADGANSRVRAQLLPHAAGRVDTGVLAVAGKHLRPHELPAPIATRANIVLPRGRGSLFTATWVGDESYILWGYADATDHFPPGAERFDGPALQELVTSRLAGWSPAFRTLIRDSDPATVNAFRVRSATPVKPWPTTRVTLLGDAIHNMTPMAGVGANTALRDAALLRRTLIAGAPIAEYEREMLDYGFRAVRQSLRNARSAGFSTRAGRAAFRSVLRLTAATPPLRRAMARSIGQ